MTPTPTATPTPAPRCAPELCGPCGWTDGNGICYNDRPLPNGDSCCNISSTPIATVTGGLGAGTTTTPPVTQIAIFTTPKSIVVQGMKCDARCGICGVSDSGGVCQDTNSLPDGQVCCHNSCVGTSCTKVSGTGQDSCKTSTECFVAQAPTTAVSPQAPPVSGNMPPWYLLAIPAVIIIIAIAL